MASAVIFDVDGTLLDSVDLHAQAWVDALCHFGVQVGFDEVRRQIGKGGDQLLPVFLSPEDMERRGEEIQEFRAEHFSFAYLPRVRPFPAVRELLQRVRADGSRVALATSAKGEELRAYERIADIEDLLDATTSKADAEKSKPHPDIFVAALERLGDVPRDEVVVVGDTPYDAEAAGRAGVRPIGVLSGGFPEDWLRRAGCVAIYRDAADLLARYDESPLARRHVGMPSG